MRIFGLFLFAIIFLASSSLGGGPGLLYYEQRPKETSWYKPDKMTRLQDQQQYQHYFHHMSKIEFEKDVHINMTVPLSLLWRHCYVRHPIELKKDTATHFDFDSHAWSTQFRQGKSPNSAAEVLKMRKTLTKKDVPSSHLTVADELEIAWTQKFTQDFGVDPTTLDVHDYRTNFVTTNVKHLFEQCTDSALPFYFPYLFLDEADVILVEVSRDMFGQNTVQERIEEGCPPPSNNERACLIYLRVGQMHKRPEMSFVYRDLFDTMERRNQKFVIVSAFQEIWCTPYGSQPVNTKTLRDPFKTVRDLANKILDSPLLVAWFGKNLCENHPKLFPVPLGPKRKPNAINVHERQIKKDLWLSLEGHRPHYLFNSYPKPVLVATPMFEISTTGSPSFQKHKDLRPALFRHLEKEFGEDFVAEVKNLTKEKGWPRVEKFDALHFFLDIRRSKFNFAPVGAAIDSHRAWESLMLGTIPIVYDTTLNSIFDGLPVIILKDMKLTSVAFLDKKYKELKKREYHWDRLYGFYWIQRVRSATYLDTPPDFLNPKKKQELSTAQKLKNLLFP